MNFRRFLGCKRWVENPLHQKASVLRTAFVLKKLVLPVVRPHGVLREATITLSEGPSHFVGVGFQPTTYIG